MEIKSGGVRWGRIIEAPRARLGKKNHLGSGGKKEPWKGLAVAWPYLCFRKVMGRGWTREKPEWRQEEQSSHCCRVLGKRRRGLNKL